MALALAEQAGYRVMAARAHEAVARIQLDSEHARTAVELYERSEHRVGEARARALLDRTTAARR